MPLRYVNYKYITMPLAQTSLGTPHLHSSHKVFCLFSLLTGQSCVQPKVVMPLRHDLTSAKKF